MVMVLSGAILTHAFGVKGRCEVGATGLLDGAAVGEGTTGGGTCSVPQPTTRTAPA